MIGLWYDKKFKKLTLVLKSFKCSWNKCIFCNFADESANSYNELRRINLKILEKATRIDYDERIDELVIFNGGSFFELPFDIIIKISELTTNKIMNIETRPNFITEESILMTLRLLDPKKLIIRIGFESFFSEIRDILNKNITQKEILRIIQLRKSFKDKNVIFVAYVLFGMDKIGEKSVETSVTEFNKIFDGVIAIKYRKYKNHMPKSISPSKKLLNFLKNSCLDLDMAEDELWKIRAR